MYRKGHYGVSLLAFAPLGFALLSAGRPTAALVAGGTMVWLATLPDVDLRVPGLSHRGPTHTLAFAALVGAAFALVGVLAAARISADRLSLGAFGFALGAVTVGAHLLADLLTPAGVALLWPLSGRRYSLSLTTADDPAWNYGLLAVGVLAASAAVAGALPL